MTPYPRPSNRKPSTLRPLSAEMSPLHRSDGSASLKCGNTHILAAVQGPIAPRIPNRERYDRGIVSVAFSKGLVMMSNAAAGGGNSSGGSADLQIDVDKKDNVANKSANMTSIAVPLPSGGGATERELEYFLRMRCLRASCWNVILDALFRLLSKLFKLMEVFWERL